MLSTWQFGALQMFGYDVLLIDPPWDFSLWSEEGDEKSARRHYKTMPLSEIRAFRMGELCGPNSLILMFAVGCMLPQCIETLAGWGFAYKSEIVWRKVTKNGKVRMGTGYRVRTMHEPLLLATVGNPKHQAFPSIINGLAREHSRKPDEVYFEIEKRMPHARRADIFSRQQRPGWDAFGDEDDKFNAETTAVAKRPKRSAGRPEQLPVDGLGMFAVAA